MGDPSGSTKIGALRSCPNFNPCRLRHCAERSFYYYFRAALVRGSPLCSVLEPKQKDPKGQKGMQMKLIFSIDLTLPLCHYEYHNSTRMPILQCDPRLLSECTLERPDLMQILYYIDIEIA